MTELRNPHITDADRVRNALMIIHRYGGIEGDHHRTWVIDQVVQTLVDQEGYPKWIADYENGEDGSDTYSWDTGIAP